MYNRITNKIKISKIILILSAFMITTSEIVSQDYFIYSLKTAIAKAKKENKRIFADFTADWCKPCKLAEKYCFPDPDIRKILEENYVCVKIYERGYNGPIFQYGVRAYPTFMVMEKDGKEVFRWSGYGDVAGFLSFLNSVPPRSFEMEKYDSLYVLKSNDQEFLYEYHDVLLKTKTKIKQNL